MSLQEKIKEFCEMRDWDQFHNPKDLSIGIVTEASELLDIFRFKSASDISEMLNNKHKRDQIGQELADIIFFILRFAQLYDFDLDSEVLKKLKINEDKYPVEKSKGSNLKYTEV